MEDFQEERFSLGQIRLNAASGAPSGAPLALLHGVARRWMDFAPLLPALCARYHLHALDFRGHGLSDRADEYLVEDYTRDAVKWIEALATRLEKPIVVYGHSLGAMAAAAIAAQSPDAVRAIVLEDPPYHAMGQRIRETPYHQQFIGMRDLARRGGSADDLARGLAEVRVPTGDGDMVRLGDVRDAASLRQSAQCLAVMDAEVLTPVIEGRWLDGHNQSAIWNEIHCPVLLLQADSAAGGALDDEDARRIETSIRRCTRVQLSSVGHLIHWQQPETVLRLVNEFLE